MILGIDASNISAGGGVTHLVELLCVKKKLGFGFSKVVVWSKQATLDQIKDRSWLEKIHLPVFEKGLICRILWQRFQLSRMAKAAKCDVLFVPGGSYAGNFRPVVTMSQNLLPFEWKELRRYGWSARTLKLIFLRLAQSLTFQYADGLIFLTQYARDVVMKIIKTMDGKTTIIPHGVADRFSIAPRRQQIFTEYSKDQPFRILYVSIVSVYKHQWQVAKAVASLREKGLPVVLDLVGPADPSALKRLRKVMSQVDSKNDFIRYLGAVPHKELHEHYLQTDICLFASSCENMPNILLEAMAAGLPIACSNRGPMPGMLGDAGVYFNPESPETIAEAIKKLFLDHDLRHANAMLAYEKAKRYSWQRCADETFTFLAEITQSNMRSSQNTEGDFYK